MTRKLLGPGMALLAMAGCNLDNPGIEPPKGQIAYPWSVGLVKNELGEATHLVVVNSNFDLRYNAGSVQTYNLEVLMSLIRGEIGVEEPRPAVVDCFKLSTRTAGEAFDGGSFPDNTMYPDAAAEPDMDAGADAGDAGDNAGDAAAADAGDAAALDAGDADGGAEDAGSQDAGAGDAGAEFDAGVDGGLEDGGAMDPSASIVLPSSPEYGSQRGILCDGRDNNYVRSNPPVPASQVAQRCCYPLKKINETTSADGTRPLRSSELRIDSYATGLAITPKNRLYIPIRSKNRLIYIDVNANGELDCGGQGTDGSDRNCVRGISERSKGVLPDMEYPPTPNALVTGTLSELGLSVEELEQVSLSQGTTFVATAHEGGQLALFVDDGNGPELYDVLTGGSRLQNFVTKAGARFMPSDDPAQQLLYVTSSSSSSPGIDRVGARVRDFVIDSKTQRPAIQLYKSTPITLTGISSTADLRSVQVDPYDPAHLSILIRGNQQSVAFLELDDMVVTESRTRNLSVVGTGPSKLTSATLDGHPFVFASTYNDGSIYIFDLKREAQLAQLDSEVLGLSGPFEMVVDEGHKIMFVADYAASVIRVVDLSGLVDSSEPPPRIVATLGALRFAETLR